VLGWLAALVGAWAVSPAKTLPSPREVASAIGDLWWRNGLGPELFVTIKLVLVATLISVAISFALAWASVSAYVRPASASVTKLRLLGLTGLVFPFTLATGGGFALKVALLTFGMTTFLVTALTRIVDESGASHQVDFVRSLGASRARVIYEALILGPLDRSLDAIRQNVAMGWSMITMVEGIARSDGGVGAMLLTQNKHFRLAEVYAVLVVVLLVGLAIDQAMAMLGHVLCPHTRKEVTS
jgi:NitT/TauT family transport system permease protein